MGMYDILRDKSIIRDVNLAFYDKVYDHEWLSMFFQAVTKEHIINQQTDFITTLSEGQKIIQVGCPITPILTCS